MKLNRAPDVCPAGGRWCVILAGGDGKRLLPYTRGIAGDDRPKQFCRVIGGETLLEQTRRRAAQIVVGFGLTKGRSERDSVVAALRGAGYRVNDMTDNEMAKLHVRNRVEAALLATNRRSGEEAARRSPAVTPISSRPAAPVQKRDWA